MVLFKVLMATFYLALGIIFVAWNSFPLFSDWPDKARILTGVMFIIYAGFRYYRSKSYIESDDSPDM
jgi:hypothetical protein